MPRQRTDLAVQQEQTPIDLQPEENLYTVSEVAKRLRVDTTTVRRWISIGVLDAVVLPHRGKRQAYRIRERTLDKLLQSSSPSGN
jgi:excisionase family DNA binding protein